MFIIKQALVVAVRNWKSKVNTYISVSCLQQMKNWKTEADLAVKQVGMICTP